MIYGLTAPVALGIALLCTLLTGCSAADDYAGDGKMIDNGPFAATDRYIVDLGPIDLTKKEKRSFRLGNLPSQKFVAGIELTETEGRHVQWEKKEVDASVSMEIIGENGNVLVHAAGPLRNWTWEMKVTGATDAFLYNDGSPGSFFDPEKGRSYRMDVSVIEPDGAHSGIRATLRLKSGGWK